MRYTENVDSIDPLEDGVRKELLSGKFTVLVSYLTTYFPLKRYTYLLSRICP